jgi:5-methyltetrahydrofolate--homocysteine methyltransferase
MERANLSIPLMIGGATTSKVHTAVKIEQNYTKGQTVHVLDASRSVTVVESLLGPKKEQFVKDLKADYDRLRDHHAKSRASKELLTLDAARNNRYKIDFKQDDIVKPKKIGITKIEDLDLALLVPYIDWTPFFQAWELHGKFPAILSDDVVGNESSKLFEDAQNMLSKIIDEQWLKAKAVVGLFPANSVADDIEIYSDETRSQLIHKQFTLRQQTKKAEGQPNIALSDFIAPKSSHLNDYIGAFVVTTGGGLDEKVSEFEKDHDDYNAILLKALADRFAEAFAEFLHEFTRKELWGYASDELLSNEDLIKESYRGIRPAPGYPACPDHSEKIGLFEILNATEITGVSLTESLAMFPVSSVSGWYFGHPEAKYFGLGKITEEQVHDLANRKKQSFEECEKWLRPVIA